MNRGILFLVCARVRLAPSRSKAAGMDFDEYEYLEKSSEIAEIPKEKERRSSRHHRDGVGGGRRSAAEHNGDKVDSGERDRSERREKDRHRSGRDADKDHRDRDRDHRERDRESSKGKERERPERGERERAKDAEGDKERENDRSPRSGGGKRGRYEREVERESNNGRSRDRGLREREPEREVMDRDTRRSKEKKEGAEPEADPERDLRTVFAYQMPLKATERDIYEFFSTAGKVRDVRLIMDRSSRRSKGVGYVEFYDTESVPKAIAMSGYPFLGHPVLVKPSEAEKNLVQPTAPGGSGVAGTAAVRKIYVGNLHFNMTEDQLRKVFEPFGEVELVQLPQDLETGQCKGYGFVQFSQVEHAKAALTLNGNLDIAGRIIKVSAVTDHIGFQDSVANATNFDDDEGGGLYVNARSRALLMQKLDRTGTASSIAESLGVPVLNGALSTQHTFSLPLVPASILASSITEPIGEPSEYILLKNMFDPSTETDQDYDLDIKEEVEEECSKFGPLKHIFVEKNSCGYVYLQFDSVAAASICQGAMHKRWFAGRSLSATFMLPHEYKARFSND